VNLKEPRAWAALAALAVGIGVSVAACRRPAHDAGAHPVRHDIDISGVAYNPAELNVAVGDTIAWTNHDIVPHTASSSTPGNSWDTGTMTSGQSATIVATHAGTIQYTCTFHPSMHGRLTVQ
jgi:plastocyanin